MAEIRTRTLICLALIVLLSGACGESPSRDLTEDTLTNRTSAEASEGRHVRVLIYGLGVARREPREDGKTDVRFFFPLRNDHELLLRYGLARGAAGLDWVNEIDIDPVAGQVMTLGLGQGGVDLYMPGFVGDYPSNRDEARDVNWMLPQESIRGVNDDIGRGERYFQVFLEDGQFETCGLVHGRDGRVCRSVTLGDYDRATSEYMLLWKVIESNEVEIFINGKRRVTASSSGRFLDILIANVSRSSRRRSLSSRHGVHLREMFDLRSGWDDVRASGCDQDVQPDCLGIFSAAKLFGGWDRPICPFIEDNPRD